MAKRFKELFLERVKAGQKEAEAKESAKEEEKLESAPAETAEKEEKTPEQKSLELRAEISKKWDRRYGLENAAERDRIALNQERFMLGLPPIEKGQSAPGVLPQEVQIREQKNKLEKDIGDLEAESKELHEKELFHNKETVNGIEISVAWSDMDKDYTIYFPQIEFGEAASEKGVHDQIIRIGRRPEAAKQVFEYAANLAQTESDVYALYRKVEDFIRNLPIAEQETR